MRQILCQNRFQTFLLLLERDAVEVAVVSIAGDCVMVKQFRAAGIDEYIDAAGGDIHDNETIEDAAVREVFEESGYRGDTPRHLGTSPKSPYVVGVLHQFIITNAVKIGEPQPENGGVAHEVILVSQKELFELTRRGESTTSSTNYLALFYLGFIWRHDHE